MARELEAKFAAASLDALREVLRAQGEPAKPCRFERNAVFDTPGRELKARGELLRLRQCGGRCVLTWKRPSSLDAGAGIKAMEEVETTAGDFGSMSLILRGLGYGEAFWYEKCRETWRLGEALVCLDLLPFGEFVEIEGEPDVIARAAATLGLDMGAAMALTYHDLYRLHLERLGQPPADSFVFAPGDKARLKNLCQMPEQAP